MDHDATSMRMKEDNMKDGQLRAGYNVQVATEGQYALAYDIYSNPTDTRTLIPFLDTIEEKFFPLPEYTVADAGYGSDHEEVHCLRSLPWEEDCTKILKKRFPTTITW